jgi:hypothetical protein
LKAVDMFGAASPADPDLTLIIPEEADLAGFSPGYRARVTSSVVKWGWSNDRRSFQAASRVEASPALIANLGRSTIDFAEELPDSLCQWLASEAVATPIAERMVEYFAPGLKLVRIKSAVRRPWLEPGDPINVRTDLFIGRDPETGRSIRGPMVALARVQRVDDIEGTDITAWIRTWDDVLTDDTAVTPNATVCGGCHIKDMVGLVNGTSTDPVAAHMVVNGASFSATRNADGTLIGPKETCAVCHGPGRSSDVKVKHRVGEFQYNP